jgi:hypothetical protein
MAICKCAYVCIELNEWRMPLVQWKGVRLFILVGIVLVVGVEGRAAWLRPTGHLRSTLS